MTLPVDEDRLLTPEEVGTLFRVEVPTVHRWLRQGRLRSVTTPGGHKRVRESVVRSYLDGHSSEVSGDA